ncbi:hypothetical protein L6270_03435 [Candidatus Parcubacteria bacterium]|nr:hypothetical protein [Patescibacteria group bacterium]MBU4309016.1 hypothetical protein [Patescibacteria group bacterium]MBU4432389.1 hypothetical protein [Patescibacteria group bacterium]MBU4577377.1 hypothetical protein [Patescibacteria group bacterium]MCG2697065.1 hypothetical protein [Candidatus Parcubacteria bacterium]
MDQRKEKILLTIIKEHIKTGVPVGSTGLVEKYDLGVSSATIRNEMADLEEDGYIMQPHTSAGRIPTEKAYDFFLEDLKPKKVSDNIVSLLKELLREKEEADFKKVAKALSEMTNSAVFWAFHKHNLYYTGISNLFKQPEFLSINSKMPTDRNYELIYDISSVIDRMEDIIDDIFEKINEGENIWLGSKNPFGNFCGSIVIKYKLKDRVGVFGLLGPMRMDYEKNIAIMRHIEKLINS